jgi:hypothetical protein
LLAPNTFKVSIEFEAEFVGQTLAHRHSLTRPSGALSQRERGNSRSCAAQRKSITKIKIPAAQF